MDKYLYRPAHFGKILEEDWDNFQYEYIKETEYDGEIYYEFDWQWAGLKGFCCIKLNIDRNISESSTVGTKDESPVQIYKTLFISNDSSLLNVFKKMLADKHRWK